MSEQAVHIARDAPRDEAPSQDTISGREARRSFVLGVINGTVWRFAESLIDPPLVLTWFASQLTSSNVLIGLVSPVSYAGYMLPQMFVSARVQRMRLKMPMYVVGAVVRFLAWLLLVTVVWMVDDPRLLLLGFFTFFPLSRTAAGLSGLSFFDIIGKTIPAHRRGAFFAWRQLIGGALGLLGGWIVNAVLARPSLPFPRGHAVLFLCYALLMVISTGSFIAIREPPGVARDEPVTLAEQLRRGRQLLRQDSVFRRYIGTHVCLSLTSIAAPFFGLYAKNGLGAPDGMVGLYVTIRAAALLAFNLPWGFVSDRKGNRLVLRLMTLGNILATSLALVLVAAVSFLQLRGPWLPYLAIPIFFLSGAMVPAQMLVGSNFLLELVPENGRSLYMGVSNTLIGIAMVLSGLGGGLADLFGFAGVFGTTLVLLVIAYLLAIRLPEPRCDQLRANREPAGARESG